MLCRMRRFAACAAFIALLFGACGSEDPDPRLVAAVGDSITAGSPGWDPDSGRRELLDADDPESQWEYWAEAELGDGYSFRNCGVPGNRTDEIAARLETCIDGAEIAVLQGGVNDLAQGRTPAFAARNLRAMVKSARAAGLPVFLANVLPVNNVVSINDAARGIRPKITRLNRLIEAFAREEGVPVVDFFGTLEDPRAPNRMRPEWTAEGLHPSVEGYRRLGHAVATGVTAGGN